MKMKNILTIGILSIFIATIFRCETKRDKLIKDLNTVYRLIDEHKTDSLLLSLDEPSIESINFLKDTTNLNFENAKQFEEKHKLMLFTTVYNDEFGDIIKKSNGDKNMFMMHLYLSGTPLFN